MHGSIMLSLESYVRERHGAATWTALLAATGLTERQYDAMGTYPDSDVEAIVAKACEALGAERSAVLEDFGRYVGPLLLEQFFTLVDPSWRTLDLIEHTEATIHAVVRLKSPGAAPPKLEVTRLAPDALRIDYRSERRMEDLAVGLAHALAEHYGERLSVSRTPLDGGGVCIQLQTLA
jgi:hypothetical protein